MTHCQPAAKAISRDIIVFCEPTLSEMLADPVIRAVMQADRVDPEDVRVLMQKMQRVRS